MDREKQLLGVICCNKQSGFCPCLVCSHDDDGMCWGCVCCGCQVDPCWLPRNIVSTLMVILPCCLPCEYLCYKVFCLKNSGHGKNDQDTDVNRTPNPVAEMKR